MGKKVGSINHEKAPVQHGPPTRHTSIDNRMHMSVWSTTRSKQTPHAPVIKEKEVPRGKQKEEKKRRSHRKVRKNKDQGKKRGPQNEQSFDSLALRRW